MSVMRCDHCGDLVDTDKAMLAAWSTPVCEKCFEDLAPEDAWNLALDGVRLELAASLTAKQHEVLRNLGK